MHIDPDFVTARRLALQSQCRPAHWQCPKCDAYYPLGASCGACDGIAEALAARKAELLAPAPLVAPDDLPPPSGWRERPALL